MYNFVSKIMSDQNNKYQYVIFKGYIHKIPIEMKIKDKDKFEKKEKKKIEV